MAETTQDPRVPFTVCDDDPVAQWYCPVQSDVDPDDHWSGWANITADARLQTIEHDGVEYTPTEARHLADALRSAADHAEHYGRRAYGFLNHVAASGHLAAVIGHLPAEQQAPIRDTLRQVADRYRNAHPKEATPPAG